MTKKKLDKDNYKDKDNAKDNDKDKNKDKYILKTPNSNPIDLCSTIQGQHVENSRDHQGGAHTESRLEV